LCINRKLPLAVDAVQRERSITPPPCDLDTKDLHFDRLSDPANKGVV
jgi:hypothetical protein